ncbi:MAG: site-specific DNA-methyltransferase [Terriglobia bacterium]
MARKNKTNGNKDKRVTRYSYENVMEPRTPETGHTALLPADEQVVTVPMDNGWSKAIMVGKLPEGDERPVVLDMDPAADPTLFWAGKRNHRQVPILPLQRNEIVSDSRIAQIVARARKAAEETAPQFSFGSVFAGLEKTFRESDKSKRVEFYTHEEGWKNKLICGDSLHVMESLLYYEALRGKVQMIFLDPPYGIKYDSNFQQRVDSINNDEKDQSDDVLTIKAFRDTWVLGVHSYLSYLQERLYLCRELLNDSGSIFLQISDDNVHRVRCLMDEVFGADNFIALIPFRKKTMPFGTTFIEQMADFLIWYGKQKFTDSGTPSTKFYPIFLPQDVEGEFHYCWYEMPDGTRQRMTPEQLNNHSLLPKDARVYRVKSLEPSGPMESGMFPYKFEGKSYPPPKNGYGTPPEGLDRLRDVKRLQPEGNRLTFIMYADENAWSRITAPWTDTVGADNKRYAVQTNSEVIRRCMLMTTDPGDIVFDPTCGSGSTASVAESWGRRWITCDTSRVAINVTRKHLLSSVFDQYRTRNGAVASGFIYKKVKRITLGSLANNLEPGEIELRDQPDIDKGAIRVCGAFEVMSLGRYSIEDWKGYVAMAQGQGMEAPKLENYIEVICRLYRKDAAVQGASGLIHAVSESDKEKIAISVGPLSGRVTAKQIDDAVKDAVASGILETHILGWAFESNVNEVKAQLEKRGKVKVELIMIRPDTLAEGLKVTNPETLFSPLAMPDIEVAVKKNGKEPKAVVRLKGVAVFDRKNRTTDYKQADSGYVSAWYLDEDYDGDCFIDCQMFFDFKKAPNLKALGLEVEPGEFKLQGESQSFPVRGYKRIAVKVVDVFGNESTVVREL